MPLETLYDYCRIAREILKGEHAVGRVIARPFITENGKFKRTANRHDFSLLPPKTTLLDALKAAGKDVVAVGKISDIFAGKGVTKALFTHSNREGMETTDAVLKEGFDGLCFTNLVDFDMNFGHRQDVDGYANALSEFDAWLGEFVKKLEKDDILMITADHGCDPADDSTDHTREHTPLVVYGENIKAGYYGVRASFADIAASCAEYLEIPTEFEGTSFLKEILK